jgi:GNAT superfamily N-acetyltransferase
MSPTAHVRRELRPGDIGAIIEHHGRVYAREHGVDSTFEGFVAATVADAAAHGYPSEREAVWIVELEGTHAGSLGLTDEGGGTAALRWFLLDAPIRGRGLGRSLVAELIDRARGLGYTLVGLETFSALTTAARIYRDFGFEVVSEETGPRWGRDEVTFQRYELALRALGAASGRQELVGERH